MNEWGSTESPNVWMHNPCGTSVRLYKGLPVSHHCQKPIGSIYDTNGKCVKCGATVYPKDSAQHNRFHLEIEKGIQVSQVRWCDMGDHAFKAGSPGSQSLDVKQTDENGMEHVNVMDVCGEHAFGTKSETTLRAIEKSYERSQASVQP